MTSAPAPAASFAEFAALFHEEHRAVRDLLLALADAFESRDLPRARALLAATGPHFRYEEEALYPALVPVFGDAYVEQLFADHDLAIASARRLAELAGRQELTDAEAAEAVRLVRGILPHVSDCEGLSIMVELLPQAAVETLLAARAAARAAGLDLLAWAAAVRGRPA